MTANCHGWDSLELGHSTQPPQLIALTKHHSLSTLAQQQIGIIGGNLGGSWALSLICTVRIREGAAPEGTAHSLRPFISLLQQRLEARVVAQGVPGRVEASFRALAGDPVEDLSKATPHKPPRVGVRLDLALCCGKSRAESHTLVYPDPRRV